MKTSKFFLSTLIAASAMTATAYAASISYDEYSDSQKSNLQLAYSFESNTPEVNNVSLSEFGNVSDGVGVANGDNGRPWTTSVNKDEFFSGGAFTISFDLIAFSANNWTDALSLYTNGTTSGEDNSIQLQKNASNELMVYTSGFTGSNVSGDASNFKLGSIDDLLGKTLTLVFDGTGDSKTLTGYVDGVAITDTVTFTYADGVTPSTALTGFQFGAAFGGGRVSTSVTVDNVALWNTALSAGDVAALIVVPSDFTWAGGASGNWTDTSWTSGEDSDQALSGVPNVTFNDSVTMTATGNVSLNSLTVVTDSTLTLAGAGTVSVEASGIDSASKILISADSTLSVVGRDANNASVTVGGTGTIEFSGSVTNFGDAQNRGTLKINNVSDLDKFTGTVRLKGVQVDFTSGGSLGDATNVILDNGSLHFANTKTTFDKTITIAEGSNGYIRSWGNNKFSSSAGVTISGTISGAGTLTSSDDGDVEFTNTVSVGKYVAGKSGGISKFSGETTLGALAIVSGATVQVSRSLELTTGGGSGFEGTLEVLAGGTLTLSGHDALGYNNGGLDSGVISLQGNNSTEKASLVINDSDGNGNNSMTLSKTLELKGYSTVSATEGRSFNSWNGKIKASGIENEISSAIGLRKELIVDVEDGGKLIISGNMFNGQDPVDGGLLKSGSGELTLSGNNTYTHGTTISAGTLVAGSNSALGTNFVKISGGKLEVSSGVTVSNNITVVLGDTLDAAVITGDGSLGGKITLDYAASAENVALALATEETTKTYTLLSGNVGSSLSMDFFELGTGWADGWKISDYVYNSETGVGTLTLGIPEPSAFGLLAGVGALALVASRRRRSRR